MEDIGVTVWAREGPVLALSCVFFIFSVGSLSQCDSFFCVNNFYFLHHQFLSLLIHFLLNRVPTAYNSLLAGSFITVFVWNVSSSIQNWCLRFFAFRAKLIHVFVFTSSSSSLCCLLLLLSFFLSFSRKPFSFLLFRSFPFLLLLLLR